MEANTSPDGLLPVSEIKTEAISDEENNGRHSDNTEPVNESTFHNAVEPTNLHNRHLKTEGERDYIYMPEDKSNILDTLAVQPDFIVENAFVSCGQLPPPETSNSKGTYCCVAPACVTTDESGSAVAQSDRQSLFPESLSSVRLAIPMSNGGTDRGIPKIKSEPSRGDFSGEKQLNGGSRNGLLSVEKNLIVNVNAFDRPDSSDSISCVTNSNSCHSDGNLDKKLSWPKRLSKWSNTVRYHLTCHPGAETNEKPYGCDVCPKRFSHHSTLVTHKKSHSDIKPLQCNFCPKRFYRRTDRVTHERTHTGEKPYACIYCSKRFAKSSYLPIHQRTHTGEKPFDCKLCAKRFATKCDLTTHERSHTGEKPYTCQFCSRGFSKSCNLKRHELTHTTKERESLLTTAPKESPS